MGIIEYGKTGEMGWEEQATGLLLGTIPKEEDYKLALDSRSPLPYVNKAAQNKSEVDF